MTHFWKRIESRIIFLQKRPQSCSARHVFHADKENFFLSSFNDFHGKPTTNWNDSTASKNRNATNLSLNIEALETPIQAFQGNFHSKRQKLSKQFRMRNNYGKLKAVSGV